MYRGRLWTMRQYAGFATAAESNARYRYLLAQGVSGLSVAFDLPTQMGYDSDHPLAAGEVGRVGVAIDSIEDMATLFDGIPLDRVSTSMTINATAIILLSLYVAVARRQGVAPRAALGHGSERHPQGIRRARHLHLSAARVAAHRHRHLRVLRARDAELEHDFDQRLSHPRSGIDGGAGGRVHVRARAAPTCRRRSTPASTSTSSASGCRSSSTRTTTSSRRSRSSARRAACGRASCAIAFGATNPRAQQLRFHTQTAGSTLTAQQPDNNIVRVALQALAAVLGGTQSLHCNGRDEALALPTEESARIALRTQQIIASETGVANTVDPVAGSYAIETLTNEIERGAEALLERIERAGGTLAAIESRADSARDPGVGVPRAAGHRRRRGDRRRRQPVRRRTPTGAPMATLPIDPEVERQQIERVRAVRAGRSAAAWQAALAAVTRAARDGGNLVPPIIAAVEARATVGEIADAMRAVFGEYKEIASL